MNHADAIHLLKVSEESLHAMNIEEIKRHYRHLRSNGHPDSSRKEDRVATINQHEVKQAFIFIMQEVQENKIASSQTSTGIINTTLKWYELTMIMNHWMLGGWYSSMIKGVLDTKYK